MAAITLRVPLPVLPATPPPKAALRSISRATSTDGKISSDTDAESEQHTLSSYGDLSFSDSFMLSSDSPDPPQSGGEVLQPKLPYARPRFHLKVRRPPMPKRRLSYVNVGVSSTGSVDTRTDGNRPGSPDPFGNLPRNPHQPLVSPLNEHSHIKASGPATVANSIASKDPGQQRTPGKSERVDLPQPPMAPVAEQQPKPVQAKSNSGAKVWRTRLPPRPPLPKWDV